MCTLMDGSTSVSVVMMNLEVTAVKESILSRDLSLKKTSKGDMFKVVVWS